MNKKMLVLGIGVFVSSASYANVDETCAEAASRLNNIIEDWYSSVMEYSTPEKNPSVISMYKDYKKGSLERKFIEQCKANWSLNRDIFQCFSGVRTEMGATMCMHPDSNKNKWKY